MSPWSPVPFAIGEELYSETLQRHQQSDSQTSISAVPSATSNSRTSGTCTVPGEPRVRFDRDAVFCFLDRELGTPILDDLYDRLWLFSSKSGDNIDPLHRQRIKGRQIMPCEDPNLHLIWTRHAIYVKPLPACLLNHDFWAEFLQSSSELVAVPVSCSRVNANRKAAIGFLKSYAYLVQSPADFSIAKQAQLIPDFIDISWHRWAQFIDKFLTLDEEVSLRYRFGQLRLNRLSFAVFLFRPPSASCHWFYAKQHWSTTVIIENSFELLLFIFASLALALSCMQVALAVPATELGFPGTEEITFQPMNRVFWLFSVAVLFFFGICWLFILTYPVVTLLIQLVWTLRKQKNLG